MDIRGVVKTIRTFTVKHGPEILTAVGTVGLIVSGIMAVNQTPRAMDILQRHEDEKDLDEELTTKEKFQDCWKVYLPSVALAASSVACIIFARRIDAKRMAAWAAAYQMSENALIRLQDSIKDEFGERKLKKIEDNADLRIMEEHPINPDEIISTGNGDDLFCDYYSGRYFRSNPEAIKAQYNSFISDLLSEDGLSVNDWLSKLDLPLMGADVGDRLGFTSSMYQSGDLWNEPIFTYGPGYLDKPCAVVKLSIQPKVSF